MTDFTDIAEIDAFVRLEVLRFILREMKWLADEAADAMEQGVSETSINAAGKQYDTAASCGTLARDYLTSTIRLTHAYGHQMTERLADGRVFEYLEQIWLIGNEFALAISRAFVAYEVIEKMWADENDDTDAAVEVMSSEFHKAARNAEMMLIACDKAYALVGGERLPYI